MGKYASKILEQARAWLGRNEAAGTHKAIIDVYNAHKPLARNYKVKYTDAWCSTFVSAVAIKCGYTDIIPTECGCGQQIELFKKIGAWEERDNYIPNPGDIIFYDWDDNGIGDNTGWSDHVGIVEEVVNGKITVIEGNCDNSVKRNYLQVNGKSIRGYGVPKYDVDGDYTKPEDIVKDLQYRGIVLDKAGMIAEMKQNLDGRLYWLGRKAVKYMNDKAYSAKRRNVTEYTTPNDIVWELANRGIITDKKGMIEEMQKNMDGRLYWLGRKVVQYIGERDKY